MAENIDINVNVNGEEQLKDLSVSLRNISMAMAGSVGVLKNLDARQRGLNQALGNTNKGLNDHAKSLRQAIANQTALSQESKMVAKDLARLKNELRSVSNASKAANMREMISGLRQTQSALKSIKGRAFVSDLKAIATEQKRLGKDAQFVGRSLIIGITTPLTLLARNGIQAFYNLDKQTVRLNKLLGATGDTALTAGEAAAFATKNWQDLGVRIEKAGANGAVTTTKIDALKQAISGISSEFGIAGDLVTAVAGDFAELGINATDVIAKLTELTTEFSILGNVDISAAQDLTQALYLGALRAGAMTGRINDFNTAAEKQAWAVRNVTAQMYIFNSVENATALSLEDIAATLPEAGAAALSFGINFNQAMALLAPMKAAGIDVSAAATGIKTSFQKMANPTIKMQKQLQSLSDQYRSINPVMADHFLNVQGIGISSIQSLVNVTEELQRTTGAEGVLQFYSALFDDRQSTRMLIAFQDMVVFQQDMVKQTGENATAQGRLVKRYNDFIKATNAPLKAITNIEEMTQAANLAKVVLKEGETEKYVKALGRTVTEAEVKAAKQARKDLEAFIKEEQAANRNAIEDITSEAGKVLAIDLVGAASAAELAEKELAIAKDAVSTSIDRIKTDLKSLFADIITTVGPAIKTLADKVFEIVTYLKSLSPNVKMAILGFAAFAAALGPLVFILGQVRLAFGVVVENILRFVPGLRNMSVETVASASKLLNLKKGLTMTGTTIVNTNSRFATLVATIASGNGPIARMVNKFGELTGILQRTQTAAKDVVASVDEVSIAGQRAISRSKAQELGALTGTASGAAQTVLPLPTAIDREIVPDNRRKRAIELMHMQGITAADRRATRGFKLTPKGKVQGAKGRFVGGKAAEDFKKIQEAQRQAQDEFQAAVDAADQRYRNALYEDAKVKKRDAKLAAKGIIKGDDGTYTRKGRRITTPAAFDMAGGLPSRISGRAQIGAQAIAGVVKGGLGKALDVTKSVTGFNMLTKAITGSKTAMAGVAATGLPGFFAKAAMAVKGFALNLSIIPKLFSILRIALISTGIGAIILAASVAVMFFIKNFEKIKTAAAPGLEALRDAFGAIKDAVKAIIQPFKDFIGTMLGADEGESSVQKVADAFNKISEWVKKAAETVRDFVNKSVVPFLRKGLSAIMTVIRGVVAFIRAILNLRNNTRRAFSDMESALQQIGQAMLEIFVGLVAPLIVQVFGLMVQGVVQLFVAMYEAIVAGAGATTEAFVNMWFAAANAVIEVVNFIISAFDQIPVGIGAAIRAAANLIADWVEATAEAISSIPLIGGLIGKAAGVATGALRGLGNAAASAGASVSKTAGGLISGVMSNIKRGMGLAQSFAKKGIEGFQNFLSGMLDSLPGLVGKAVQSIAGFLSKFAPKDLLKKLFPGGDIEKAIGKEIEDAEDGLIGDAEDLGNKLGDAMGGGAGDAFKNKLAEAIKEAKQKFVDLVLGFLEEKIGEAVDDLVAALEKQRDAALKVYEDQLDALTKLEKAEEALMREREYIAERKRILDERELQRQNYIRNRALAIYEGRVDDARLLDLEERKSQMDSTSSLVDLQESRNQELRKENFEYIREQIEKTKEQTNKFFSEQIEAFQEASKKITKFAPVTIEEYEAQLTQLTDLAKEMATANGDAFAETFTNMTNHIQTSLPNVGAGVFGPGLDQLVAIARQRYGLEDPNENTIVGATIGMLSSISSGIGEFAFDLRNGVKTGLSETGDIINSEFGQIAIYIAENGGLVNTSMQDMINALKNDIISVGMDEINDIIEEKNPQTVLAQAIADANETIRREFETTVGHIASKVDELADSLDPLIEKIIALQLALENLNNAAGGGGGGGGGGGWGGGGGGGGGGLPTIPVPPAPVQQPAGSLSSEQRRSIGLWIEDFVKKKYASWNPLQRSKLQGAVSQAAIGIGNYYLTNADATIRNNLYRMFSANLSPDAKNVFNSYMNAKGNAIAPRYPGVGGGGSAPKRAYGGMIPKAMSQSVPALLHGGEYIVSAKAVANIGLSTLQAMNGMRFATPSRQSVPQGMQTTETTNINIYVDNFIGEDKWFESMMKEYNMKVVPKNQKTAGLESRTITSYNGINRGM